MADMFPAYVNYNGWFDPQKHLGFGHPDHMREIGYNDSYSIGAGVAAGDSTGGYPIEQAAWMAGGPNPDFMSLGGSIPNFMENLNGANPDFMSLGGGCCGWKNIGLTRDPKTGITALTDFGFQQLPDGLGKTDYYSVPTIKGKKMGLNGYYSLGALGVMPMYYSLGQQFNLPFAVDIPKELQPAVPALINALPIPKIPGSPVQVGQPTITLPAPAQASGGGSGMLVPLLVVGGIAGAVGLALLLKK